jgi:cytochrome c-type biogenesis protein CcmH
MKPLLLLALLLLSSLAHAQVSDPMPLQFQDAAEETRFHALTAELRCVMCQNQSLADSNALIALSLRREVLEPMRAGQSDAQIKDFLVQRYGEFVLYKPRVEGRTWLLWLGPALILLGGAAVVMVLVRRRPAQAIPRNDEPQEW